MVCFLYAVDLTIISSLHLQVNWWVDL